MEVDENETFTRSFSTTDENQFTVCSLNPENQSVMTDMIHMNDAEAINRLIEIGFGSTAATIAYNRAGRNLEDAIESLLG